jgi:hypothetical protein
MSPEMEYTMTDTTELARREMIATGRPAADLARRVRDGELVGPLD